MFPHKPIITDLKENTLKLSQNYLKKNKEKKCLQRQIANHRYRLSKFSLQLNQVFLPGLHYFHSIFIQEKELFIFSF